MAEALSLTLNLTGSGRRQRVASGASASVDSLAIGNGDWRKLQMALTLGSSDTPTPAGVGYANAWYFAKRTCATAGTDNLDLTGLTNNIGETFNFAKVKAIIVALYTTPDGSKLLKVGPQNVTNGFVGSFGGGGATVYKSVYDWEIIEWNKWAGYTVDGTHKIVGVSNPGGADIDYLVGILGVHA